ncbi:MAG: TerC/Alx family metal homeostasis membrane protein [Phycisphaerales bacterium]|nr:TerC/Alx family metal homeostasis membrane protein [Phycisphaerales bacterium]
MEQLTLWGGFVIFVLAVVAFDLFFVSKKGQEVSTRKALLLTAGFVTLGLLFTPLLYWIYTTNFAGVAAPRLPGTDLVPGQPALSGREAVAQFLQAWLLEYSLSVDNLFVFALIFTHFQVPKQSQHRVLLWGIIGALILRALMIGVGAAAVAAFSWLLYVFGALLIFTAFKLATTKDDEHKDFEKSLVVRLTRRIVRLSPHYDADKFLIKAPITPGSSTLATFATPLLLVLIVVESTDVMFAIDSIPAAFGVTKEPFIIFAANIFAILGLRSLYFALAGLMDSFRYLKYSLAVVLGFIGVKMILEHPIDAIPLINVRLDWHGLHIPTAVSLGIIAAALLLGVLASLAATRARPTT